MGLTNASWIWVLLAASLLLASPFGSFAALNEDVGEEELVRISEDVQFSKFNESFIETPDEKGYVKSGGASAHASSRRSLKACRTFDRVFSSRYTYFHNVERNAKYKRPLKWDNCLAARAQDWATKMALKACALPPKLNKFGYTVTYSPGDLGENLFYAWYYTGYDVWNVTTIMNYWTSQKKYYNYKNNSCGKKKFCGNYLQIVWKPASTVGCGVSVCNLKYAPNWKFKVAVCDYDKQFFYDTRPY